MITNDRQYKITKLQIENFQTALDSFSVVTADAGNTHPKILQAHKSAIESQLNDLLGEVSEYEDLKAGRVVMTEIRDLADLPLAIIKSRIANGLTQAELAEKLGLKMQQIQKYEAERYDSASLKTLLKIAGSLGLKVDADIQLKEQSLTGLFDIKNYPFKQMYQRGWFGSFAGSLNDAMLQASTLISGLYQSAGMDLPQLALTKRTIRSDGKFNDFALDAWYARIIAKARLQTVSVKFKKELIDEKWLKTLRELSKEENGPLLAAEYLRQAGIRFIIEQPLEGTYLDGAALLLDDGSPVIAMTLRHDRLDNFWFVLFHEISHIMLHLSESLTAIFDDLDMSVDGIEKEADEAALEGLIPNEVWRKSLIRFNPTAKGIVNLADSLGISPALIAGRLRKEKKSFFLFNELIGQGEVRKCFINTTNY
jgi:HTH-type transcriptional regulator/antitoxin HigA